MRILALIIFMMGTFSSTTMAQVRDSSNVDTFKAEVLALRADVDNIKINLEKSHRQLKRGIFVATLGYSITIAGGLMLGRKHDDWGKGLLIAGGVTGITGTAILIDSFRYLGKAGASRK